VRDAEDQIEIMMLGSVQSKVTSALLKLAGRATGASDLTISPVELSTRVGLDVEAVLRRSLGRPREVQRARLGRAVIDLSRRPELASLAGEIALWRDRYVPPAEFAHDALGRFPYLGRHYEFLERAPGSAPGLAQLYGFSFCAVVSMGPHSTSISGHKYSVPRLIRGITRSLFLEQQHRVLPALQAYREPEIDWPPRDDRQTAAE